MMITNFEYIINLKYYDEKKYEKCLLYINNLNTVRIKLILTNGSILDYNYIIKEEIDGIKLQ